MKIGIAPTWHPDDFAYMLKRWGNCVSVNKFDPSIGLLILPGGADVDTKRYGEKRGPSGQPDPEAERFDTEVLPLYLKAGIPVFGICRGHQSLAVTHGMKLIQDMSHPYHHYVKGKYGECLVNSMHHQAVKEANNTCKVIAKSDDNIIEALQYDRAASVQWHPEFMREPDAITIKLLDRLCQLPSA